MAPATTTQDLLRAQSIVPSERDFSRCLNPPGEALSPAPPRDGRANRILPQFDNPDSNLMLPGWLRPALLARASDPTRALTETRRLGKLPCRGVVDSLHDYDLQVMPKKAAPQLRIDP